MMKKEKLLLLLIIPLFYIACYHVFSFEFKKPIALRVESSVNKGKEAHVIGQFADGKEYRFKYVYFSVYFMLFDSELKSLCFYDDNIKVFANKKPVKLEASDDCSQLLSLEKHWKTLLSNSASSAKIVALIVLAFLSYISFIFFKGFSFKRYSKPLKLFIAFIGAYSFVGILLFPGFFDIDLYNTYANAHHGHISSWFSYLNDLLFMATRIFFKEIYMFLIIQMFLMSVFSTALCSFFIQKVNNSNRYFDVLAFLFFISPPISFMTFFITRDWIFFIGVISLFSYVLYMLIYKKAKLSFAKLLLVAFGIAFLVTLRREFLFSGSFLLIVLAYFLEKKRAIALVTLTALFYFGSSLLSRVYTPDVNARNMKLLFTFSHGISSIITDPSYVENDADRKSIEQFFHYDILKKHHSEADINPLFHGARKVEVAASDENFKGFAAFTLDLFKRHPWTYLKGRLVMFSSILGLRYTAIPYSYTYYSCYDHICKRRFEEANIQNYYSEFSQKASISLHKFFFQSGFRFIFFNFLPAILVLLFVVTRFPLTPVSSSIAVVVLLRLIPIFILIPASQQKYIIEIYAMGGIIIPFYILEKRSRT